jgi:hypothetical protein
MTVDPNQHDVFVLRQKIKLVINQYEFFLPNGSEPGEPIGFVPYVENVADWLPIPYHFVFKRGEEILGENTRQFGKLRDIYTIDMSPDAARTVDRRLVLALAVGQDALQAR